jgi:large conductance mechanosensitive channel
MWQEFKKFIARGNVIDLAVGIIMGAAFTSIVQSLVNDVIMPPVGVILGGADFSDIFILLQDVPEGETVQSVAQAEELGLATINIGIFINAVINFLIVAIVVFFLVRSVNRLMDSVARGDEPDVEPVKPQDEPEKPEPDTNEKLLEAIEKLTAAIDKQNSA